MGQYHYLVNLDKKEVIHPHQIGNGLKLHEQIGWPYATATVLVMLLASSSRQGGRGGGDFRAQHPLVGSWAGDRLAFVGDYAEEHDLPGVDARLIYQICCIACGDTEDNPPADWREWKNISGAAREMMGEEFGVRYSGDGWLDIVQKDAEKVSPNRAPDLSLAKETKRRKKETYA